ncbi:lumican isoform X1 [Megalobrama amblycephala]|uniref:lumican isoform X1 n=2 Tax=Megalobrama amblycephala TaxID=75352 RepID=UPI00201434D5|nr:lumican isoform X1 [Megalobrama amblycephala]
MRLSEICLADFWGGLKKQYDHIADIRLGLICLSCAAMFALGYFLLAGLVCQSLGQYDYYDEYYMPSAPLEGVSSPTCAQECECPISFPTAMYCNDRNLKFIPIVPSGIKYLYLQNNLIEEIKAGVFDNVTDLRWLVLDNNKITSDKIQAGTIDKLGRLEKLYFSNNQLTKPPGPLSKSMDELKLIGNDLSSFPASTLSGMENLTTLHLSKNKLTTESITGAFKSLKSLVLLDVSENKLKKLPSGVPASLLMLYADNNEIDSIPGGYLAKLPALQYLRVSHNKLVDSGIPGGVFNASSLLELDLSFNKLKTIPEINESLEHLYLQVNEINKFDLTNICKFSSPVNYSRLRTLRLDGNNLTHSSMPDDTANCLRQASEIIFD